MARNRYVLSYRNQMSPRYIDERDSSYFVLGNRRRGALDASFFCSGEFCCHDCCSVERELLETAQDREYVEDGFAYCCDPDCCYFSGSYERYEPRQRFSSYYQPNRGGHGGRRGIGIASSPYSGLGLQGVLGLPAGYGLQPGAFGGMGGALSVGIGGFGRTGGLNGGYMGGMGTIARGGYGAITPGSRGNIR